MISVNNLNLSYGTQTIFDDISFNINSGERIGLTGRNGSGKTTLFNLLSGRVSPDSGAISYPRNYTVGYLEQQLAFSRPTVIEEACLGLKGTERNETWKAEKVLTGLGFSNEEIQLDPAMLSGGFQVRLNLAKTLVAEPDLLLLDEPTNYLDIVSLRWLGRFLRTWPRELMLITHDRSFMDSVTNHTMMIHRNKLRKVSGGTYKIYEQIAKEEEIYEKTRLNDAKKRREAEEFINRFRAKARLAGLVQSRIKALEKQEKKEKLEKPDNLEFSFNAQPLPAKKVMEMKSIAFGYTKDKLLIEGLTIAIGKNDRIGVIGRNGMGKTTLLRLMNGELTPERGTVKFHPDARVAYFGQTNIHRLNVHKTIEQELFDSSTDANRKEVRNICGAMMFPGNLALKKIAVLSGGERSRVLLGKLLLSPANLLLLDEPTNHLDMESCDSLIEAVDAFPGAAVIVTHNELFLHSLVNRLIIFDGERVTVFEGSYQDFLDRIGWSSESAASSGKQAGTDGSLNRTEFRRAKSQLINERNRALRPLEENIRRMEGSIEKLENQIKKNNEEMILASAAGNSTTISSLSIENHAISEQVDSLYADMEKVLADHDKLDAVYREKLASLG